ncbi:MAG: 4Fe-4S binding protein [Ignavibacteria bacterium]|jgi:polyferredoxin
MIQVDNKPIQKFRFIVQIAFVLLCLWIGYDFYKFVSYLESGGTIEFSSRPPGVDGFLPISSLMSFYLFLKTGTIHPVHPAGLLIFFAIVLMSFLIGKSFCSWFCPVGFLSEMLGDVGEKLFKRKIKLPKFLDYPLRSIKYLLLAFLVYTVFFMMNEFALKAFLDSSYNIVADIKMYYFFAKISRFSLIVIGILFLLSIIFRNFWCRYLCPYGALLGFISLFSPNKIKRISGSCINCKACTKVCPSHIKVHKAKNVISDECTSCLSCIDACPVKNTLIIKPVLIKKELNKKLAAGIVVSVFLLTTGIAMLTGNWQNNIAKEEYLIHFKNIEKLNHFTGTGSVKNFNDSTSVKKD